MKTLKKKEEIWDSVSVSSCLEALDGLLPGSIRSAHGLDEDAKGVVAELRAFCKVGVLLDARRLRLRVASMSVVPVRRQEFGLW